MKTGEREPLLHHNNNNSSGLDPEASVQQNAQIDNNFSDGLSDQASPPTDNEAIRLAALQALPWYRRPSLYWLMPLIFLAAIVLGVSSFAQEQCKEKKIYVRNTCCNIIDPHLTQTEQQIFFFHLCSV